jgi:ABC-2 type transport system permease protein
MLNKMRIIKNILIDELRFISKDIDVLMIILIAPMVYAFFYGSIYLNKSEADVPVVIIDNNNSEISRQLIRELNSHQLIEVKYLTGNFNEAKELLNNGEIEGIIIFPEEMSVDLKKGLGAEVKVYLNTSRFLVSNDLNKGINEVIGYFNASVRLNYFLSAGLSSEQALETIEPIRAEIKPMYNFTDNYGDFLIPAIFILILQQTLLIGLAESFTKQRQKNTLHKVFDMAEGKIRYIIFGKGFFYILLYSAYALFFFTITFYTFSLSVKGNILSKK